MQLSPPLSLTARWYQLFKAAANATAGPPRGIWFSEFVELARRPLGSGARAGLGIGPKDLSDAELEAVWAAIDEDASGDVSVGEFGRFMRIGAIRAPGGHERSVLREREAEARREAADRQARMEAELQRRQHSRGAAQLRQEALRIESALRAHHRPASLVSNVRFKAQGGSGWGTAKRLYRQEALLGGTSLARGKTAPALLRHSPPPP